MTYHSMVKGIYKKGKIEIIEKIQNIKEEQEVLLFIPFQVSNEIKGLNPNELLNKSGYISIGGDALIESENIYND